MLFSHLFNQPAHLSCQALAASCLPHGISARALALVPARARLLCARGGQQSHWHQARGMERGSAAPQEQSMARQAPPALGRPGVGTLSRFLEVAPDPADPCRFPPATASQPSLPNVLGERSQVRQSGDKSKRSLAALALCLGLIGGSGSPPAPLTPGLGWPGWQPGLLAGSC